jgi:nucleolar GTP-binding protein
MIMFLVDTSETCGHSLEEQFSLFESLKPLFAKRPVLFVFNKIDLVNLNDLDVATKELLNDFKNKHADVSYVDMSTMDDDMVRLVRETACKTLLDFRISGAVQTTGLKTDEDYYKGVRMVVPSRTRKGLAPTAQIPLSVIAEQQKGEKEKRVTLKEMQDANGGAGVFGLPMQEHHVLENASWKYDIAPEIINGMNVWDYVDPEIEQKLLELEHEEEELNAHQQPEPLIDEVEQEDQMELLNVRKRRKIIQSEAKIRVNDKIKRVRTLNVDEVKAKLNQQGINNGKFSRRATGASDVDTDKREQRRMKKMEIESDSTMAKFEAHQRNPSQRAEYFKPSHKAEVKRRKIQKRSLTRGQAGDSDRHVYDWKPKHLFSGKRGIGKNDRR